MEGYWHAAQGYPCRVLGRTRLTDTDNWNWIEHGANQTRYRINMSDKFVYNQFARLGYGCIVFQRMLVLHQNGIEFNRESIDND